MWWCRHWYGEWPIVRGRSWLTAHLFWCALAWELGLPRLGVQVGHGTDRGWTWVDLSIPLGPVQLELNLIWRPKEEEKEAKEEEKEEEE